MHLEGELFGSLERGASGRGPDHNAFPFGPSVSRWPSPSSSLGPFELIKSDRPTMHPSSSVTNCSSGRRRIQRWERTERPLMAPSWPSFFSYSALCFDPERTTERGSREQGSEDLVCQGPHKGRCQLVEVVHINMRVSCRLCRNCREISSAPLIDTRASSSAVLFP